MSWHSSRAAGSDDGNGVLRPRGYEVGSVGWEDCVVGRFLLRNVGDQELVLRNVRRNCACYKIFCGVGRLEPGASTTLSFELTFPKGKRLRNAIFYILSNEREEPLRLFVVKLTQSDDPDFAASKPNQVGLQMLDESADKTSLEVINREQGVVGVKEPQMSDGKRQFVLMFPDGTDIAKVARSYLEHPSVGLVLFGARAQPALAKERIEPSAPVPSPPAQRSNAPVKRREPLEVRWFYAEGCAFCDDVKRLPGEIWASFPARTRLLS